MKKYFNIKTIILLISVIINIAGVIVIGVSGFEKSLDYKYGKRIEVYIPEGYEKQEIMSIAKESFNTDEILFLKVEKMSKIAGIKVNEYTQEQLEIYLSKIEQKYNIEAEKIEYHEIVVPETKISTIINPYILPIISITILSSIYVLIKNYKLNNKIKILFEILGILVITLCLYFSIIALFRLQFTIYTMPLATAIYIAALLILVDKKCE